MNRLRLSNSIPERDLLLPFAFAVAFLVVIPEGDLLLFCCCF
jgi:hypothetical protein